MEIEQYQWLNFALKLPTAGEFLILVLFTGSFILIGKLIKSYWERNNETVPIPIALGMGFSMLVGFFFLVTMFYRRMVESNGIDSVVMPDGREMAAFAPDSHYIGILVWCMVAVVFPLFYYGLIIVNSFASRAIDRVSPFGMQINEPSEFAEARKMALRGNVDGAVKRYRAYLDNTEDALFEAARLLKSEDRFAEAAALFQEIGERFFGKKLIWAEAIFQLAKLKADNLHQTAEAMALLEQVIERTYDSRYGQLSHTELARMASLYGAAEPRSESSNAAEEDGDDPFFDENDERHAQESAQPDFKADNGQHKAPVRVDVEEDEDDVSIPNIDPFFAATQRIREEAEAEEKSAAKRKPKSNA
ncbi:MAG: hypothetical protein L3K26_00455 [Candidatus Hydrogenedentes bacterium]|nr:hypothetical protein [Candidatus Hydrogenedentota bacterium]